MSEQAKKYLWKTESSINFSSDTFPTQELALADGREQYPDSIIEVGIAVPPQKQIYRHSIADEVIEHFDLWIGEEAGAEDSMIELPVDKKPMLDKLIHDFLAEHMDTNGWSLVDDVKAFPPISTEVKP